MEFTIENEKVTASFTSKGAEIISLKSKDSDIEYIWQADPNFWFGHAPVLFPFIGQSKNKQYEYDNKIYPMTNHGFARTHEFKVTKQSKDEITFRLCDSEETMNLYPFHFSFEINYRVVESTLAVTFYVKNTDDQKTLYYSLGAHPAFNVPIAEGTSFEDYALHFSPRKKRNLLKLKDLKDFLIDLDATEGASTDEALPLQYDLFTQGLFAFETKGATTCTIQSTKTAHCVEISYENMPYLCVWSPTPKKAPFICIEPWGGIPDVTTASGRLEEKLAVQKLAALGEATTGFKITVK
ncbi:MAG: aldose epimerase [Firmicutes bacterium]|nr:aldose epimerase [Bacillota bacterium]